MSALRTRPAPIRYRSAQTAGNAVYWGIKAGRYGYEAYVYPCVDCVAWHIGLDGGQPWHRGRTSCDVSYEIENARDELRSYG